MAQPDNPHKKKNNRRNKCYFWESFVQERLVFVKFLSFITQSE